MSVCRKNSVCFARKTLLMKFRSHFHIVLRIATRGVKWVQTVILLYPHRGLKVKSDRSRCCCGTKWKASKQNVANFLICSTGFGRQLEEALADRTKRLCSRPCRGGASWTERWVTDQERFNVFESGIKRGTVTDAGVKADTCLVLNEKLGRLYSNKCLLNHYLSKKEVKQR